MSPLALFLQDKSLLDGMCPVSVLENQECPKRDAKGERGDDPRAQRDSLRLWAFTSRPLVLAGVGGASVMSCPWKGMVIGSQSDQRRLGRKQQMWDRLGKYVPPK